MFSTDLNRKAYSARHRKPQSRRWRTFVKGFFTFSSSFAAACTLTAVLTPAALPGGAAAAGYVVASLTAHHDYGNITKPDTADSPVAAVLDTHVTSSPDWTARTCAAFTAWQQHPTTGHLDAMMTASERAPWKYVGEDTDSLYRAVRAGRNTDTATQYLYEDCHNGYGS